MGNKPKPKKLNLLFVEDQEDDALLLVRHLRKCGYRPEFHRVDTGKALREALESDVPDVILCDYKIPGFGFEAAIKIVKKAGLDIPVIVVSGTLGEEKAEDIMRSGAHDLVLKDSLSRLAPAIERELREAELRRASRLAERRLGEERSLLHNLMSNIPDAIYFKDLEHRYTRLNDVQAQVLKSEKPEDVIGRTTDDFLSPERVKMRMEEEKKIFESGEPLIDRVEKAPQDDGTVRWLSATKAPIRDQQGAIVGLVGITRDITQNKQAEDALRLSEEQFRAIVETARDGFISIDGDGNISQFNPAAEKMFGYDAKDAIGKSVGDLIVPDKFRKKHEDGLAKFLRSKKKKLSGGLLNVEAQRADGTIFPVELMLSESTQTGDRCTALIRDVSDRKKSEEKVRKLTSAVQQNPMAVIMTDVEGTIEYVNPKFVEITGYNEDEMIGQNSRLLKSGITPQKVYERLWTTVAGGKVWKGTFHNKRKDGTIYLASTTISPILSEDGTTSHYVGVQQDVTLAKQSEKALAESEERFRAVVDSAPSAIFLTDRDGRFLLVNKTIRTWMNAEEADIVGKSIFDLFPKDQAEQILKGDLKVIASGTSMSYESKRTHLDGITRDVVVHRSPIRDSTNKIIAVGSIVLDVTERKRAEEALAESEQRLSFALEGAAEALWDWDVGTDKVYFSNHLYEMLGYRPDDLEPRMASWQANIHPDDKVNAMAMLNDHIDGRSVEYVKEYRIKTKAGNWIWISDRGRVVAYGPDGQASRIVGTYTDITDRKRSEQALRESEQRFKDFAEAASDWFWEMGPDLRFTHMSEQFEKITGLEIGSVLGKRRDQMALGDPADEQWETHLADLEAHRPFYDFQFKVLATDGQVVHISSCGIPIFDESANFRGYRGTGADITARVEAENKIRQHDKMDSLGNLAGGIAHDFNNMLQPIMGLTQRVLRGLGEDDPDRKRLEMVLQASERARDLVKQILTFSRKENHEREHVDPGHVTREALDLLRVSLPSTLEIEEDLDDGVGRVFGDAAQISTVLMNLATNAADAMEGKPGRLTFSLSRTEIDGDSPGGVRDLAPGSYAHIRVADSGKGMDKATLKRVFDPFFTTKAVGQGTGLGLAVVHGVVNEHGGAVSVSSEIGKGTTFDLYFPVSEAGKFAGKPDRDKGLAPHDQTPGDTESRPDLQSVGT